LIDVASTIVRLMTIVPFLGCEGGERSEAKENRLLMKKEAPLLSFLSLPLKNIKVPWKGKVAMV
jgi:hypothetical protein